MKLPHILLSALLLLASASGRGQVTGFMGKKLIVHGDVASSFLLKGIDLGAEYALLRSLSLTVDYNRFSKSDYLQLETAYEDSERSLQNSISGSSLVVGFRLYTSQEYTAPKGGFAYFQYGMGKADFRTYSRYEDTYTYGGVLLRDDLLHEITAENVPVRAFEFGSGAQYILYERISFEYSLGYVISSFDAGEHQQKVEELGHRYGPNLLRLYTDDRFEGQGFSGHLKIGYLIY
jgi:hypothetical protein